MLSSVPLCRIKHIVRLTHFIMEFQPAITKLTIRMTCAECQQCDAVYTVKPAGLKTKPLCEICASLWVPLLESLDKFNDAIDRLPI
jgi:hypothetical protein